LHVDLWNAKAVTADVVEEEADAPQAADAPEERDLHRSLAERLRFTRGRSGGER
jgi:hypothetical protein